MVESSTPSDPQAEATLRARCERHREIQAEISDLSDGDLLRLLPGSPRIEEGHVSITLPANKTRVFAKLLPLTVLERAPQNLHSTDNLFRLPSYYHYRLGSWGFGTSRELAAHRLVNDWVLSGQSAQYPLLHAWRTLPIVGRAPNTHQSRELWGPNPAIERRVLAVAEATSSVVLFLEHFPETLGQSLRTRLQDAPDPAAVLHEVATALMRAMTFLHDQDMLHMDMHLENVLVDEDGLYLTDFGLAISRTFDLDAKELEFFDDHAEFDRRTAVTCLVHAVVAQYDTSADWRQSLRALLIGSHAATASVPSGLRDYLAQRGPVALEMGEFFRGLLDRLRPDR